eukprot:TRINITY_DN8756_c0_g1_i1.p1 TRINITY_DN8756_c0_g1~~TRINITY_DN8756_c0_g1_i1.p1  ORF type:complete len:510 (-),score=84.70 TRINITY_DN8756_c0_g1_i1:213-1670(-)
MRRTKLVGALLLSLVLLCLLAQFAAAEEQKKGDKGGKGDKNDKGGKHKKEPVGIIPDDAEQLQKAYNGFWLLIMAPCVFYMQTGFLMLEVGSVRVKNTKAILLKNTVDSCISALTFWAWGWTLGFTPGNGFLGMDNVFLIGFDSYDLWFYQFTFCNAATTIVSGAIAERVRFEAYMAVSVFLSGWIYPIIAHWLWGPGGWLNTMSVIDFAGSGVVHVVGGTVALVGAIVVGPRIGRFVDGRPVEIPGHSIALSSLGVVTLWFGWFAFNGGSTLGLVGGLFKVAERAMVNTLISPATAGLITLFYHKMRYREYNIGKIFNGILGGAAFITAPCAVIDHDDAIIAGAFAAALYEGGSQLLIILKIDDVVDAAPVHFLCGMGGLVFPGFFAHKEFVMEAYGRDSPYGLLYGGGGTQLGIQLLALVCIVGWCAAHALLIFGLMRLLKVLRVDKYTEEKGLDVVHHSGFAYTNIQVKVSDYVSVRRDVFV